MKYPPVDGKFFAENRKRFTALMKPNSIAVFHSNDQMPRNGDDTYYFRQNSDLWYLTGIDQEETTLILYPDSPRPEYKEVLFVRQTNDVIAAWEGHMYTKQEAYTASGGIKTIVWNDEFDMLLTTLMVYAETVYINLNENDRQAWKVPYRDLRFAREIKRRYPLHHYERGGKLMLKLRQIKSQTEIDLIKKACGITRDAFLRTLKFVKPGVMEYEVEAEIIHEFLRQRATTYAYYPIIASGKDSCVLHYHANNKECKDGDILSMDFGCEYSNYASDLTRVVPVNGKFTPRQKEVYNAVLRAFKQLRNNLRPGTTLNDHNNASGKIIEEELIKLGLLKAEDVKKQDPDRPLYKRYYMHGASHFMGLDTHDLGHRFEPMKAGMVFTCEPGIYIPEENIGIRIEDDILVTDKDPIDLMADIPVEADEIEALMAQGK
jgi:Xaa-Pro aminopeptidase